MPAGAGCRAALDPSAGSGVVVAVAAATAGAESLSGSMEHSAPRPPAGSGDRRAALVVDDPGAARQCPRSFSVLAAVAARSTLADPPALAALSAALAGAATGRAPDLPCLLAAAARPARAAARALAQCDAAGTTADAATAAGAAHGAQPATGCATRAAAATLGACLSNTRGRDRGRFALRLGGVDEFGRLQTRRVQRRLSANLPGPKGLALQGRVCGVARLARRDNYGLRRAPSIRGLAEPTRLTCITQTGS